MTIAILVLVVSFLLFLYLRHIPVFGIGKKDINDVSSLKEDTIVVDVRDYQTSFREPIHQAYRIPFPYLKRFYKEIPDKNIVIIASNHVEKNLCIRLLRRRGHQVIGYDIPLEEKYTRCCHEM